jgi:hypothetical protein
MNEPVSLSEQHGVELFPVAPFHFDATMHNPDHFPSADNAWEPRIRWQTMLWRGKALGLKFENQGTLDRPRVCLSIRSGTSFLPFFTIGTS